MSSRLKQVILLIFLVGAAAGFCYWKFRRTPEHLITKAVYAIAEHASREPGETNRTTAFKLIAFGRYLAPQVDISAQAVRLPSVNTAEELSSHVARARLMTSYIRFTPMSVLVTVTSKTTATAEVDIRVQAASKDGKHRVDEFYFVKTTLQYIDGKWLFNSFHQQDIIQK